MRKITRSKYGNKFIYVVDDEKEGFIPFKTKRMAEMYAKQIGYKKPLVRFDSQLEYQRYVNLMDWERKGIIRDLKRQVTFELVPKQNVEICYFDSNLERPVYKEVKEAAVRYIADACYYVGDIYVVEDTKSEITRKKPDYRIKKKLMLEKYNIWIKEVDKKDRHIL